MVAACCLGSWLESSPASAASVASIRAAPPTAESKATCSNSRNHAAKTRDNHARRWTQVAKMPKKCPFVVHNKVRNRWVCSRSCVRPGRKIFKTFKAAREYAVAVLHAEVPQKPGQRTMATMQKMARIYKSPLIPADLSDAIAHVADDDVFRHHIGAEAVCIMLKYRPVRVCFTTALRMQMRGGTGGAGGAGGVSAQAKRLVVALLRTVRDCGRMRMQPELELWARHWGTNVSHHSGWLPFLQRRVPSIGAIAVPQLHRPAAHHQALMAWQSQADHLRPGADPEGEERFQEDEEHDTAWHLQADTMMAVECTSQEAWREHPCRVVAAISHCTGSAASWPPTRGWWRRWRRWLTSATFYGPARRRELQLNGCSVGRTDMHSSHSDMAMSSQAACDKLRVCVCVTRSMCTTLPFHRTSKSRL